MTLTYALSCDGCCAGYEFRIDDDKALLFKLASEDGWRSGEGEALCPACVEESR